MVDREGIPLSMIHTAANVHDSKVLEEAVDAISPIPWPQKARRRRLEAIMARLRRKILEGGELEREVLGFDGSLQQNFPLVSA